MSIATQAELLFESKSDAELLDFAAANWPESPTDLGPEHAELARFARISAYRTEADSRGLWQARHVTSASLSGNLRSLSLSLQPLFFSLVADGLTAQAREVVDLMAALSAASTADAPPRRDLVDRITAERRAYSFVADGSWAEAEHWYAKAAALAPEGSRGKANVAGGAALARWLGGGSDAEAAAEFARLAEVEWPDVQEAARANLAAAERGDRTAAVPFDLV